MNTTSVFCINKLLVSSKAKKRNFEALPLQLDLRLLRHPSMKMKGGGRGGGGGRLFSLLLILVGFAMCFVITPPRPSHGESLSCLMVYKQGGAPAVFDSSECPRWNLSLLLKRGPKSESNCQFSMLQGRRTYQEDRIFCELNTLVPFQGKTETKEVKVGIAAVFDGHRGAEASEMASQILLEYFLLHASFLLDDKYSSILGNPVGELSHTGELDAKQNFHALEFERSKRMSSEIFDGSFQREIFKESLLRAIDDINATFSKEAFAKDLRSGSTASVVLLVDGQMLVANVGDSKALLCSERFPSSREVKDTLLELRRQRRVLNGATSSVEEYENFKKMVMSGGKRFFVKELTTDHHPDRDDERSRIEAAGGYITEWNGVPRVNGELAVSRSIGDVSFKSYGVVSEPEVTDWQPVTADDSYLVVASDGVLEKMSTQDVCDLTWELHIHKMQSDQQPAEFFFSSCNVDSSVADCIVNTAFEKGSMDNMAAIVVPLGSTGSSSSTT